MYTRKFRISWLMDTEMFYDSSICWSNFIWWYQEHKKSTVFHEIKDKSSKRKSTLPSKKFVVRTFQIKLFLHDVLDYFNLILRSIFLKVFDKRGGGSHPASSWTVDIDSDLLNISSAKGWSLSGQNTFTFYFKNMASKTWVP